MRTGNVRKMLIEAMKKACDGNLSADDGRNIIGLANQISNSMNSEIKVMQTQIRMGVQASKFGSLKVYEEE